LLSSEPEDETRQDGMLREYNATGPKLVMAVDNHCNRPAASCKVEVSML
jgi:hypothetical protein